MKNEKKVGTPILGSRELKLFESVVVEFMLQELGFHVAHVQPGSYHIYERDPAGDEDLHLGSETEVLPKTLSICNLGGCLGNLFLLALIDIYQFDWIPKTLPIFIQYRGI